MAIPAEAERLRGLRRAAGVAGCRLADPVVADRVNDALLDLGRGRVDCGFNEDLAVGGLFVRIVEKFRLDGRIIDAIGTRSFKTALNRWP